MAPEHADDLAAEKLLVGRQRREPEEVRERLLAWLQQRFPDAAVELPLPSPPPNGGSSESFFIAPRLCAGADTRTLSLMVRIEPTNRRIYEMRSIERQYGVMKRLHELGTAPVPRMWFLETDPEILGEVFLVMEKVEGVVPHDRYHATGLMHDATPERRRRIWSSLLEAMAGIHNAPPAAFAFLDRPELGGDALEQELAVWESYVRWSGLPLAPEQARAQRWLRDNRPAAIVPGLSWGDARLPNTIFRDDRCQAVLDWETVSLCGAENDLAWMIFYDWFVTEAMGVEPLEGIPDRDETLQLWSRLAGREPRAMHWHEVAATFRFTLLRDRSIHLAGLASAPFMAGPDPLYARLGALLDR